MKVSCYVENCKYHEVNGWCGKDWITIDEELMIGFFPVCRDYEEKEGEDVYIS